MKVLVILSTIIYANSDGIYTNRYVAVDVKTKDTGTLIIYNGKALVGDTVFIDK
jgi:hypothetical protein